MSSAFDPQQFLDAQVSEVNEKRPPLPEHAPDSSDGLYTAVIGEITPKTGTVQNGPRAGQSWVAMNVQLKVAIPQQLQDELKLQPELTLTDSAFLDTTPEGGLDNSPGRNRKQRQYREACDLNKAGDVFSWRKLTGQAVKIKIKHEMYEGNPQERVDMVLKRA